MKTRTALLAGIVAATVVGAANAATLSLTFVNVGPAHTIKANYNTGRSYNQANAGGWNNYQSGRMKWTNQYGHSAVTYCTQLTEYISGGQTAAYTITSVDNVPDPTPGPMGAMRATLVRDLYHQYFNSVVTSNDQTLNAAFQLAIWEITHENVVAATALAALAQLDVFVGALATDSAAASMSLSVGTLANQMIQSLDDDGFNSIGPGLKGLTNATIQDQLIVVPLPMTALLAGAGLLGVIGLRRRLR